MMLRPRCAAPVRELSQFKGKRLAIGPYGSGTRVLANASPEPFSNWFLSIAEDLFVVGLGFVALKYPAAAAVVVIVCLALIVVFAAWIVKAVRRRFLRSPAPVE